MIPPFVLHRPTTLDEATGLLAELGDAARVHAGGTELMLVLREGFLEVEHLVDIKRVPGLAGARLDADEGVLSIGATMTHTDVADSAVVRRSFPALSSLAGRIANRRVRNSGTIGGSLAFAEPHADLATLLVAAGASVRLSSAAGRREVRIEGWIRGAFDVDLLPGEILTEVRIPVAEQGSAFAYERYKALERPSVTIAGRLDLRAGRVAAAAIVVGCVAGLPQRIAGTETLLAGRLVSGLSAALAGVAAAVAAEVDAGTDAYGPEDWKRHVAGVLAGRALRAAAGLPDGQGDER